MPAIQILRYSKVGGEGLGEPSPRVAFDSVLLRFYRGIGGMAVKPATTGCDLNHNLECRMAETADGRNPRLSTCVAKLTVRSGTRRLGNRCSCGFVLIL